MPTPGMPSSPLSSRPDEIDSWWACAHPDYPLQKKRHSFEYLRTIAHLRPRTNTFYGGVPHPLAGGAAAPRFLCGAGLCVRAYAPHHHQRLRRRGRNVPGDHPASGKRAQDRKRRSGLFAGFLLQARQPDRQRPAERGDLLPGLPQRVHLRPHLPGRKEQHAPSRRRVLDGGAGDRLRRPV